MQSRKYDSPFPVIGHALPITSQPPPHAPFGEFPRQHSSATLVGLTYSRGCLFSLKKKAEGFVPYLSQRQIFSLSKRPDFPVEIGVDVKRKWDNFFSFKTAVFGGFFLDVSHGPNIAP